MTRTQISSNVSLSTRAQADKLVESRGYTLRDVVTIGIRMLYQEEFGMSEKIKTIIVQYDNEESAMYGINGSGGYDTVASEAKFEELLENELERRYPGTDIEIYTGNCYGTVIIDGDKDHTERPAIDQILHNVWSEFEWLVEDK